MFEETELKLHDLRLSVVAKALEANGFKTYVVPMTRKLTISTQVYPLYLTVSAGKQRVIHTLTNAPHDTPP